MANVQVQDVRDLWVVWKNTDNIKGRGAQYISHVCETEATAMRLGKGKYVMGGNCPVEKVKSYRIQNKWLQPSPVVPASDDDKKAQARMDAERSVQGKAQAAIAEAKALGLSDEHIAALQQIVKGG